MIKRNRQVRLLAGRQVAGYCVLPLVEYSVNLMPVGGQLMGCGVVTPMGVLVADLSSQDPQARLLLSEMYGSIDSACDWQDLLSRWCATG